MQGTVVVFSKFMVL
jgi:hypothetical protein